MTEDKEHIRYFKPHQMGWLRRSGGDIKLKSDPSVRMDCWEIPDGTLCLIRPGALVQAPRKKVE